MPAGRSLSNDQSDLEGFQQFSLFSEGTWQVTGWPWLLQVQSVTEAVALRELNTPDNLQDWSLHANSAAKSSAVLDRQAKKDNQQLLTKLKPLFMRIFSDSKTSYYTLDRPPFWIRMVTTKSDGQEQISSLAAYCKGKEGGPWTVVTFQGHVPQANSSALLKPSVESKLVARRRVASGKITLEIWKTKQSQIEIVEELKEHWSIINDPEGYQGNQTIICCHDEEKHLVSFSMTDEGELRITILNPQAT